MQSNSKLSSPDFKNSFFFLIVSLKIKFAIEFFNFTLIVKFRFFFLFFLYKEAGEQIYFYYNMKDANKIWIIFIMVFQMLYSSTCSLFHLFRKSKHFLRCPFILPLNIHFNFIDFNIKLFFFLSTLRYASIPYKNIFFIPL